jgi:hypothetical protein
MHSTRASAQIALKDKSYKRGGEGGDEVANFVNFTQHN